MGRKVATLWHATFSIAAGVLYFFFVLPRWPELMGDTSHGLGTAARIVTGVVIGLAALPPAFTLLRARKPEYGTPQLALTLQSSAIVAHVLAGVLIVGTAISEIWLSLDNVGQWLFGVYGAAAAIALLGVFGFYLSFIAELPPPPPKPLKPKKERRQRRSRGRRKKDGEADETEAEAGEGSDETAETAEQTEEPAEVTTETEVESTAAESHEPESPAQESPTVEDTEAEDGDVDDTSAESTAGGLLNRRPTGKSSGTHRRRRTRRTGAAAGRSEP